MAKGFCIVTNNLTEALKDADDEGKSKQLEK
jgi:hypothetical protein